MILIKYIYHFKSVSFNVDYSAVGTGSFLEFLVGNSENTKVSRMSAESLMSFWALNFSLLFATLEKSVVSG